MVQYPRHAVVEFHPDWAIKSWHCVLCGSQCDSQEQLKSHLQIHEIKDVIATVITTGNLPNGASINFKHSFITDSTADVSISTGDVAAHVKKEINDSDDYMPLEEVESDNESFGAKLEPNDDDSEIPEFKIEAVHSDDNGEANLLEDLGNVGSEDGQGKVGHDKNRAVVIAGSKQNKEIDSELSDDIVHALSVVYTAKIYLCDVCNKEYTHLASLKRHQRTHTGQFFECPTCAKQYLSKTDLRFHRERTHLGVKHSCKECGKTYATKHGLKNHEKNHAGIFSYVCSTCGRGFNYKTEFDHHMAQHLGTKIYSCTQCSKSYTHISHLRCHEKICGKPRECFMCDQCSKTFKSKIYLDIHMKNIHLNSGTYQCSRCGKIFNCRAALYNHSKLHCNPVESSESQELIKCDQCSKTFKSERSRSIHMKNIHLNPGSFQCSKCTKIFNTRAGLYTHSKSPCEELQ